MYFFKFNSRYNEKGVLCKFLSLIASVLPQSSIYTYLKCAFFMLNFAKSVMLVYEHWNGSWCTVQAGAVLNLLLTNVFDSCL